jgi:hypothetical protein
MIEEMVFYDPLFDQLRVLKVHTGSWNFIDVELFYGYDFLGLL